MPKPQDLTRLNRHVFLASLASFGVVLSGLICLALYIEPSWAGVDQASRIMYQGEIGWLVVGIVLASAGIAFLFITIRRSGQLKVTVFHTRPMKMMVSLEVKKDNDSTTYYAVIGRRSPEMGETPVWRVHLWIYPPKIAEDVGRKFEGDVFLQPETGLPVAIEYTKGILWVIAGNGAVKRFPIPDR